MGSPTVESFLRWNKVNFEHFTQMPNRLNKLIYNGFHLFSFYFMQTKFFLRCDCMYFYTVVDLIYLILSPGKCSMLIFDVLMITMVTNDGFCFSWNFIRWMLLFDRILHDDWSLLYFNFWDGFREMDTKWKNTEFLKSIIVWSICLRIQF